MQNFIHIPKTGGLSILKADEESGQIINWGHYRAVEIPSFAIVRNPYDRIVSTFFYLKQSDCESETDAAYQILLLPYTDFRHFVLNIEGDELIEKIIHLKPMHHWLCNDKGEVIVGRVIPFEHPHEIDDFLNDIGVKGKFSAMRSNESIHDHYLDYLDPDIINIINRLYSLDFELFNYKKL